jgi:hypothetical protein
MADLAQDDDCRRSATVGDEETGGASGATRSAAWGALSRYTKAVSAKRQLEVKRRMTKGEDGKGPEVTRPHAAAAGGGNGRQRSAKGGGRAKGGKWAIGGSVNNTVDAGSHRERQKGYRSLGMRAQSGVKLLGRACDYGQ